MSNTGHYEETLPDGSRLKVYADHWEIEYYFQGPDLRYNGTFIRFAACQVPRLITEYQKAWQRYCDLKRATEPGSELTLDLSMNITIRVGGHFDGVCLACYHDPVNAESGLQRKLSSYTLALERAPSIQQMISRL
jgi:hypothetical protein